MKPKTQELLYFLLWACDRFWRPTFRNLTDSYESWAYRNGLHRQLARLERQHLLERNPQTPQDRVYRLTELGRLQALGGRDPQARWSREWDGRWRLVVFDVPVRQNKHREKLRYYLRNKGFGCLQNSVWISPDRLDAERDSLAGGKTDVCSLILLEARPCAGESDAEIVAGAWDFARINRRYSQHAEVLKRYPATARGDSGKAIAVRRWAREEREAWLAAVSIDPLLPQQLLPQGYSGRRAWQQRREVLRQAGQRLHSFGQ